MNLHHRLSLSVFLFLLGGIRIILKIKELLKFRFGKYVSIMRPGFRLIIPFVETYKL
jgi:regulator of protease activity HflC (stomatin/prohibitin superfamily)